MVRKRHTAEEVVKLRQADVLIAQGRQVADAVRSIEACNARRLLGPHDGMDVQCMVYNVQKRSNHRTRSALLVRDEFDASCSVLQ
jgi:hypothetical protein